MWRTSGHTGPFFSADGRPYFMVNGQPVWASSGQVNPGSVTSASSSRGIAPSVVSAYDSHESAPVPLFSSSYPPVTSPSNMKARFTSGYPTTRFAAGESQGSAPASGHQTLDPYRSAIDPAQNPTGPPLNSPFLRQYNDYKDRDLAAEAAEDQYKSYHKSAGKVSKKMKQNSPGLYDGQPPQTKDWHQSAAQYASRARDKYDEAANARGHMATDYIGYDSRAGAAGHKQRQEILRGKEDKMDKKYNKHSNTHKRRER